MLKSALPATLAALAIMWFALPLSRRNDHGKEYICL
jgi:hypothetical protein